MSRLDPTLKKVFVGCSGLFVIVIGLIVYGLYKIDQDWTDGLCGDRVDQTVVSPDGLLKVVVFERDCGATTSFSTQVSILGAGETLPNDSSGNALDIDGDDGRGDSLGALPIHITWTGTRQVRIQYPEQAYVIWKSDHVPVNVSLRTTAVSIGYSKILGQ